MEDGPDGEVAVEAGGGDLGPPSGPRGDVGLRLPDDVEGRVDEDLVAGNDGCGRIDVHGWPQPAASVSRTASTCDRSTPGNQARNSSMEAPSLRFSKRAATGTRVPRKTHAPLARSGCRSTASQFSQVRMTRLTL